MIHQGLEEVLAISFSALSASWSSSFQVFNLPRIFFWKRVSLASPTRFSSRWLGLLGTTRTSEFGGIAAISRSALGSYSLPFRRLLPSKPALFPKDYGPNPQYSR